MPKLNMFFRMTKVDEAQRLVYGVATAEVADKAREICDYETTVPHYKAWSAEIHKASGGKSFGNVREMHDNKAVGKLTAINFDDENRAIEVCAKIVDDSTWNKVIEGVLTGFSQGGDYEKRWKDETDPTLTRYTAVPAEISVVDNPCLGVSTFEYIKADGSVEMRKLNSIEEKPDAKKIGKLLKQVWSATDGKTFDTKDEAIKWQAGIDAALTVNPLEKKALDAADAINALLDKSNPMYWETDEWIDTAAADDKGDRRDGLTKKDFSDEKRKQLAGEGKALPDGSFPIENKADLANAITAHGRAKDPEKAKAHIIARAKALGAEKMLPEDWAEAPKKSTKARMKKGLCEVARAAQLLAELHWLCQSVEWEEIAEDDGSPQPAHMREIVEEMAGFVENLCQEEVRELLGHDKEGAMENAAGMRTDHAESLQKLTHPLWEKMKKGQEDTESIVLLLEALAKAGRRHSAADAGRIAEMKDHVDDMGDHMTKMRKLHKSMSDTADAMGDSTHAEHVGKLKGHLGKMDKCMGKAEETCGAMGKCMDGLHGAEPKKADDTAGLEKVAALEADNTALNKSLETVSGAMEALQKRLTALEQQPAPGGKRPALFSMEKGNEIPQPGTESDDALKSPLNPFGSGVSPEHARARGH